MTTPRSRTLNLGDSRPSIEVLEAGDGPPLLFLHGAGGNVAWEGVLPFLSSKYHVYAPLAPGFGAST
ncbi:MAG TPA: alpha/beta hydrolase, partial [Blastocatellia bacterium]